MRAKRRRGSNPTIGAMTEKSKRRSSRSSPRIWIGYSTTKQTINASSYRRTQRFEGMSLAAATDSLATFVKGVGAFSQSIGTFRVDRRSRVQAPLGVSMRASDKNLPPCLLFRRPFLRGGGEEGSPAWCVTTSEKLSLAEAANHATDARLPALAQTEPRPVAKAKTEWSRQRIFAAWASRNRATGAIGKPDRSTIPPK